MTIPTPTAADRLTATARAVHRYLRYLGCPATDAADLAQDCLLAVLAKGPIEQYELPYVLGIARNLFRRSLRSRRRRRELIDADRLHELWVESAGEDAGEERRTALAICLDALPERSRTALELRYGDGLSREQIGERIGITDEGVKSLLVRVRSALQECIERRLAR